MTFLGIAVGVLLAVLWPVLKGFVTEEFATKDKTKGPPRWLIKYGGLVVFCCATAAILMAVVRTAKPETHIAFWPAVLIGIGYEATIEKLFAKPLT